MRTVNKTMNIDSRFVSGVFKIIGGTVATIAGIVVAWVGMTMIVPSALLSVGWVGVGMALAGIGVAAIGDGIKDVSEAWEAKYPSKGTAPGAHAIADALSDDDDDGAILSDHDTSGTGITLHNDNDFILDTSLSVNSDLFGFV